MKVQDGQNLADIAIQEYGSLEALVDLAAENGISVTTDLKAGQELTISKRFYNKQMMSYCKSHSIHPATVYDQSGVRLGIFTKQFSKEFQ